MKFDPSAPVAVVLPVHNRLGKTRACLDSLRSAEGPPAAVIVVDDGSSDGTAEYLREQADVVAIRGSGDLWWTKSVELGCDHARAAGCDVIVLLNDDNLVAPNLVSTLVQLARSTNGCASAVVLERLQNGSTRIFQAGGTLDWKRRGIGLRQTGTAYEEADRTEACAWLPGCALAFPIGLYEAIGGFDGDRFPQYRGDIDFTVRARAAGFPCNVTYATWVLNDRSDSPLTFRDRVRLSQFLHGFVGMRSNYNVRETVLFAWRHCPKALLLFHLGQFYARYAWAALKTQRFAFGRPTTATRPST